MTILIIPAAVDATLAAQSWGRVSFETVFESDETGTTDIGAGAPPRWTASLRSQPSMTLAQAGAWQGLLLRLGRINHLAVYDKLRSVPQGTLRGEPRLAAPLAVGDETMTLHSAVGTLKAGDALQIGAGLGSSQWVQVLDDCASTVLTSTVAAWTTSGGAAASWTTSSSAAATWYLGGTVTVAFANPARYAYPAGTSVVWDRPVAYMRMTNNRLTWDAQANGPTVGGFAVDLIEQW